MMPAIRLDGAEAKFGDVVAVVPITLSIATGEKVALLGPSGAGKTTMLRLIGGEVRPSSGSIELHGRMIGDLAPGRELSSLVGMVHQQFDLVPNLSALQNTLAGNLGRWSLGRGLRSLVVPVDRHMAISALQRVGIDDKSAQRTSRLSGGEQQRVAIARVLVQDPSIVLADEPVASLDPARSKEILGALTTDSPDQQKTLVASMHSVEFARDHFDRLIGLRSGSLVFDSPATDVTDAMLDELYRI
ncbi:MAG: ATP-binding cassette domain-containing protein [Chloroflexi bacterium]|nr:ATP-binding cassette domain-containing protein [Chloroflexota bacterium]